MLAPLNLRIMNLGRIVPPPPVGTSTTPTQVQPKLFIAGAGRAGLDVNANLAASAVALTRDNVSNTSSPNPTTNVGSAGTAGLDGAADSAALVPVTAKSTITTDGTAAPMQGPARRPRWLKPALYIAGGVAVGWVLFHG